MTRTFSVTYRWSKIYLGMQFGTALRSDQACAETAFQAGEEFRRYVFEVRRTCHDWQNTLSRLSW